MTVVVKDHSKAIMRELDFLVKHEVRVGVLTGPGKGGNVDGAAPKQAEGKRAPLTVADVFSFHELGRGRNPKRSSIVWVMDAKKDELAAFGEKCMLAVFSGKMSGEQALGLMGEKVVSLAKMRIKSKIPPPLSAARLLQKKRAGKSGEVPLIHTGQLINSLRYNVIGSI